METWLQGSDLSSTDLGELDESEVLRLIRTHDWSTELRREDELRERGADCCPAGIGIIDGEGWILHVCPTSDYAALVHLHTKVERRLSGIVFWTSSKVYTAFEVPLSVVSDAVSRLFRGEKTELLQLIKVAEAQS